MKAPRTHLSFLTLALGLLGSAFSPAFAEPRQALTVHPVSSVPIAGFSLSYEKPMAPRFSLEVPLYFGVNSHLSDQARLFIGSGIGARFYLARADGGAYVAPLFEFLDMFLFEDANTTPVKEGGHSLITLTWVRYGYKFLWPHFTLDIGMGMGWGQTFFGSIDKPGESSIMGFLPMGHFAAGIPF